MYYAFPAWTIVKLNRSFSIGTLLKKQCFTMTQTYTGDVDGDLREARNAARDATTMLADVDSTEGNDRKRLLHDISEKLRRANECIQSMEVEISNFEDELEQEYEQYVNELRAQLNDLDEKLKEATRMAQMSEQARAKGLNVHDLKGRALDMQRDQNESLDRTSGMLNQANDVGQQTLVELQRQQEQLQHANENMDTMSNELDMAKKAMKQMLVRAAGDQCVRILAVLVILAVIAVVVVEAMMPGTVKETSEGWFSTATGETPTNETAANLF